MNILMKWIQIGFLIFDFNNLKDNPNFNDYEKKEVIQILQEKNYNQKQFETLLKKSIEVPIKSNDLNIGSILLLKRDLNDKFNLYKTDLIHENNIVGSLPINYSKSLAIEIDLNNVKLLAEVKDIKKDKVSIIIKKNMN